MTRPAERDELDGGRWLSGSEARALLLAEVEQLRACEVRVCWPPQGWEPDERAELVQYLDDGTYVVRLNPAVADVEQVQVLEQVWSLWLEPNSAYWHVAAAKPGDPASVPIRVTTLLVNQA